jgi:hypothetical protein
MNRWRWEQLQIEVKAAIARAAAGFDGLIDRMTSRVNKAAMRRLAESRTVYTPQAPLRVTGQCVDGCGRITDGPPGVPLICPECLEQRR